VRWVGHPLPLVLSACWNGLVVAETHFTTAGPPRSPAVPPSASQSVAGHKPASLGGLFAADALEPVDTSMARATTGTTGSSHKWSIDL
jgi:hypothetical protein